MRTSILIGLAIAGIAASPGFGQNPLSAIDWLDDTDTPQTTSSEDDAMAGSASSTGAIAVTPLSQASADAVGLLDASATGLPHDLWGPTPSDELLDLLADIDTGLPPSAQNLLLSVLLTELNPPNDGDPVGALFLARIDTLMAFGAVEQAHALLEQAGPRDSERFRRWFDTSLLLGVEHAACEALRDSPSLAPGLPARIFCLAHGGDMDAAVLAFESGRALGDLSETEGALLARFLDYEPSDGASLPTPSRPTPLDFNLYEAIGEPLPTTTLPLIFAQTNLRSNSGWKSRIEAAEKLARNGIVDGNILRTLYTQRRPAASGGVWDRVAAVQRLDQALAQKDTQKIAIALIDAWSAMQSADLESVFAGVYAERISNLRLTGNASALAFRIQLLGPDYQAAARKRAPRDARERFLHALARGDLTGMIPPDGVARAIVDGFNASSLPPPLERLLANRAFGAAILRSISMLGKGDPGNFGDAIALLRALGFEDVARRAALEVTILDRSG